MVPSSANRIYLLLSIKKKKKVKENSIYYKYLCTSEFSFMVYFVLSDIKIVLKKEHLQIDDHISNSFTDNQCNCRLMCLKLMEFTMVCAHLLKI